MKNQEDIGNVVATFYGDPLVTTHTLLKETHRDRR